MEYEKIIDKIKKLQTLAERGEKGEALAAKRALDELCEKNGIKLEDLFEEKKELVDFKLPYNDPQAKKILFQCYCKVTNLSEINYFKHRKTNVVTFELTKSQEIDLRGMFEFYFKQFKKEKKKQLEILTKAFISKHNIYSDDNEGLSHEEMTPQKLQEIYAILRTKDQLEDVSYHKMIE